MKNLSGIGQVFSCRQSQDFRALMRPAAEKRQCTKSRREEARWRCRERYGDVTTARESKAG
jgi:hypothetical protein